MVSTVVSFATSGLTSGLAVSISHSLGITNAGMQASIQVTVLADRFEMDGRHIEPF